MVFEKIFHPKLLETRPRVAVFMGIFFVTLGFVAAALLFWEQSSLIMVAFTSIALLPFIVKTFENEEQKKIALLKMEFSGKEKITGREQRLRERERFLQDEEKLIEEETAKKSVQERINELLADIKTKVVSSRKFKEVDGLELEEIKDTVDPESIRLKKAELEIAKTDLSEEKKRLEDEKKLIHALDEERVKTSFYSRNNVLIRFYLFLFLGMALAFTLLFVFIPPGSEKITFQNQLQIIEGNAMAGEFAGTTGHFDAPLFYGLITHNLSVVFVLLFMSILFGAGAVFILAYNASVAGIVYGSFLRILLWGQDLGFSYNPIAYLPHTIIEISGFLFAAISGGILSMMTISESKETNTLLKDAVLMFAFAVVFIIAAAYVEVTVPFWF